MVLADPSLVPRVYLERHSCSIIIDVQEDLRKFINRKCVPIFNVLHPIYRPTDVDISVLPWDKMIG